ncbi:hypothetical protein PIB30_006376 [Stylosanthes scabra]|uniref:Uncharacterized protein n=1 Tax=Stylosanthes scabra TaxID=79078 RepID=A0ABU6S431_9FABA|nr:hypothetical protein [Stylosanthes scabra]
MPIPNAGHELMRRFTFRTRRLLRIKPKYGSPMSNVVDFGSSKAAMFRWLEHAAHQVPLARTGGISDPSPIEPMLGRLPNQSSSRGQPVQNHEPFPKRKTQFDRRVTNHRQPNRIDLNHHN